MGKFFLRFFFLILFFTISFLIYVSYFGVETGKFDSLIKKKFNETNHYAKLEFDKIKIHLYISELKLLAKLKSPKILVKGNEVNLSKFDLYVSLKSIYTSNFLLEKASIAFKNNDIRDLTKITNAFVPKIINKKLKKIFNKGNLEGEFIISFNPDGSIKENYSFYGKIKEANINLLSGYKIIKLNATVGYGKNSKLNEEGLKIIFENGSINNLKLLKSFIHILFKENKKQIQTSMHTKGSLDYSEIKRISSLLGLKIKYIEDVNLTSDLITTAEFDIDKKFEIKNKSYEVKGNINNLQFKTNKINHIKKFLPSFNSDIIIQNAKVVYSSIGENLSFEINGDAKLGDKYDKFKIAHLYNKKNEQHTVSISSSLKGSSVEIKKLNYKKKIGQNALINFNVDIKHNKYYFIKSLTYNDDRSEVTLDKIKLNNNLEILDLKEIKVKTYLNNLKNNHFSIKKSDKIIIRGEVFDAQSLLKSLFKEDDKRTFSKKFNSQIKVNFLNTITGTNDDISELSAIGYIKDGSYSKLSLKGNFSNNEIIEMSIYQVTKDKKTLQLISDRARPFIKYFNFIEGFEDGRLVYESNISDVKTDSNLVISDFKVSKVPALAQLLTLASLQGIADTLGGEGIRFDSFEMKSSTENNLMKIEDALAMGPAVSILLEGYVDKGKTVSLRGTLVPATTINKIIGKIKILGDILIGDKKGEGVFGVSFKMKGAPNDIKTTVNPIKTLTPRFIVRAVEKMKKKSKEKAK